MPILMEFQNYNIFSYWRNFKQLLFSNINQSHYFTTEKPYLYGLKNQHIIEMSIKSPKHINHENL